MSLLDDVASAEFLGSEFLTWLWYMEEQNEGCFELDGELGDVELWFDDRLTMASAALDDQEDSFKGGRPTNSVEARAALKLGKLVQSAKVRLIQGDQEWSCTLKASPLSMSGIKLPEMLSQDLHAAFFERMMLLDHVDTLFKGLYRRFLSARLGTEWDEVHLPALHAWVTRKEV